MLAKYAEDFYQVGAFLHVLKSYVEPIADGQGLAPEDAAKIRRETSHHMLKEYALPGLKARCESLHMSFTLKAVDRIEKLLDSDASIPQIREAYNDIDQRVRDELSE